MCLKIFCPLFFFMPFSSFDILLSLSLFLFLLLVGDSIAIIQSHFYFTREVLRSCHHVLKCPETAKEVPYALAVLNPHHMTRLVCTWRPSSITFLSQSMTTSSPFYNLISYFENPPFHFLFDSALQLTIVLHGFLVVIFNISFRNEEQTEMT